MLTIKKNQHYFPMLKRKRRPLCSRDVTEVGRREVQKHVIPVSDTKICGKGVE